MSFCSKTVNYEGQPENTSDNRKDSPGLGFENLATVNESVITSTLKLKLEENLDQLVSWFHCLSSSNEISSTGFTLLQSKHRV